MSATTDIHSGDFDHLDQGGITREQWKVMFISGMGFFCDAYDLFIIGVVMNILKGEWHPSPVAVGLVTSTALLASALGAILFGRVADMLGRKRIYGWEVLVLAVGAIASAFSPDIWWLIFFRVILGIGIGGDYPVSATLMSEYSGAKTRGMMVSLVFAMQAAGLIVGPLLAAGAPLVGPVERLCLALAAGIRRGAGAVRVPDAPASRRKSALSGLLHAQRTEKEQKASFSEGFGRLWGRRDLRIRLIGASLAWGSSWTSLTTATR